ncbi:tetratricopeptide repeat protein, partial [Acidobacteria bacterium AH-259-A15]|nr:tetratricopeptide repeat protein [Acidobacteria bacterium AH-259-A15]
AILGLYSAYAELGEMEKVELILRQATAERPGFWEWHSYLGVHLFRSSRYEEAVEELEKATELAPKYYRALYSLGAAYAEMGQWSRASAVLERSIGIRASAEAFTNLGTAYFWQGEFRKAVNHFQMALVQTSTEQRLDFTLYGNLADALYWAPGEREKAAPQYRKAIEMAEAALMESPRDITVLGRLAVYYAMIEDRESAYDKLQKVLEITPRNAKAKFKAAVIYRKFGEVDEALKCLKTALEAGIQKSKVMNHPIFEELRRSRAFDEMLRSVRGFDLHKNPGQGVTK